MGYNTKDSVLCRSKNLLFDHIDIGESQAIGAFKNKTENHSLVTKAKLRLRWIFDNKPETFFNSKLGLISNSSLIFFKIWSLTKLGEKLVFYFQFYWNSVHRFTLLFCYCFVHEILSSFWKYSSLIYNLTMFKLESVQHIFSSPKQFLFLFLKIIFMQFYLFFPPFFSINTNIN